MSTQNDSAEQWRFAAGCNPNLRRETWATYAEAMTDLHDAGPGGICDDCGHFACRHHDMRCLFPRESDEPCICKGMLWQGHRLVMDSRTGPQPLKT